MKKRFSSLMLAIPLLLPMPLLAGASGDIVRSPHTLFQAKLSLELSGIGGHGGFVMGESVVVEEDETVKNEVVVLGGSITVLGKVLGDVVAIGGSLDISGYVEGDAVSIGGSVRVGSAGQIGGDAVSVGGRVSIEEGGQIEGEKVSITVLPIDWDFEGFGFPFAFFYSPLFLLFKAGKVLTWLLLSILVVALFPTQVKVGAAQIQEKFLWDGLIGLLIWFAFICSVIVSCILILLLIGIPLLCVLLLGYFVTKLFGLTTVFYWIGGRLLNEETHSPFALVALGGLILGVIRFAPFLGWTVWFVASLVGLGMALITRYGTEGGEKLVPAAPATAEGSHL